MSALSRLESFFMFSGSGLESFFRLESSAADSFSRLESWRSAGMSGTDELIEDDWLMALDA